MQSSGTSSEFPHKCPLQFLHAATHANPCLRQEHSCVRQGRPEVILHLQQIIRSMSAGAAAVSVATGM